MVRGSWVGIWDGMAWAVSVGGVVAVGAWVAGEVGGMVGCEGIAGWLQADKKSNAIEKSKRICLVIILSSTCSFLCL